MDEALVMRAQAGDERAFETLTERHYARLQRAAVGILRNIHIAEDATQDALVQIWRDLPKLRDPARFDGWSYRVLVRSCYAEAKRAPLTATDADLSTSTEPMTADAYGDIIQRDQLERGFVRLSMDHRVVVVLHYLVDLPLEGVAEVLEIPVGTVKSRLSRAMEKLRLSMEVDAPMADSNAIGRDPVS